MYVSRIKSNISSGAFPMLTSAYKELLENEKSCSCRLISSTTCTRQQGSRMIGWLAQSDQSPKLESVQVPLAAVQ